MKKLRFLSLLLAAALFAAGVLPGCSAKKSSPENTTLRVAISDDIEQLDPADGGVPNPDAVILQIYQSLYSFDSNGKLVPQLVQSSSHPDALTYKYELRRDVKFSDGSPMTADDVVYSLNRNLDPKVASGFAYLFATVASIKKTGDYEVTVKLKTPNQWWPDVLGTCAGAVVSKSYLTAHASTYGKPGGTVLGTGPYTLQSWTSGSEIDLAKNKNYWDKSQKLDFDKIQYKIIADDTARTQAVTTGQVDLAYSIPVDNIGSVENNKDYSIVTTQHFNNQYLTFNVHRKPLDDADVRKAIYYAIDRHAIADNIVKQAGTYANSILIDQSYTGDNYKYWKDYLSSVPDYSYDPAKAKQLLAQAGEAGGFSIKLVNKDDPVLNNVALYIQQELKALNINVTITKLTYNQYMTLKFADNSKGQQDFDIFLDGWGSDIFDPDGVLTPFYSSENAVEGGSNDAGYSNPALDKILNQEIAEGDPAARAKLLQKAFDIAVDQLPYAPIFRYNLIFAVNNRIDFKASPYMLYNLYYKDITLK